MCQPSAVAGFALLRVDGQDLIAVRQAGVVLLEGEGAPARLLNKAQRRRMAVSSFSTPESSGGMRRKEGMKGAERTNGEGSAGEREGVLT